MAVVEKTQDSSAASRVCWWVSVRRSSQTPDGPKTNLEVLFDL